MRLCVSSCQGKKTMQFGLRRFAWESLCATRELQLACSWSRWVARTGRTAVQNAQPELLRMTACSRMRPSGLEFSSAMRMISCCMLHVLSKVAKVAASAVSSLLALAAACLEQATCLTAAHSVT